MDQQSFPALQNTSLEFLALGYLLAVAADEQYKILCNYGVYAEYFFNLARKDRLFTIQDPVILQQRQSLEIFFHKQKGKPLLCN